LARVAPEQQRALVGRELPLLEEERRDRRVRQGQRRRLSERDRRPEVEGVLLAAREHLRVDAGAAALQVDQRQAPAAFSFDAGVSSTDAGPAEPDVVVRSAADSDALFTESKSHGASNVGYSLGRPALAANVSLRRARGGAISPRCQ